MASMTLAVMLLTVSVAGCAVGVGPQRSASRAAQPSVVRDGDGGGATTNTGSTTGGGVVHPPRPNV